MSDPMAHTRESDHTDGQIVRIDRNVPVTWLLSGTVFVIAQAVLMWSGQRSLDEKVNNVVKSQDSIATDVKQINQNVQVISIESVKTSIKLDELQRRVTALEATQTGKK